MTGGFDYRADEVEKGINSLMTIIESQTKAIGDLATCIKMLNKRLEVLEEIYDNRITK